MKQRQLFFDLDRTLWDFETNSCDTLQDLYTSYNLKELGVYDFESFKAKFNYQCLLRRSGEKNK